jgi:hypothetical protein
MLVPVVLPLHHPKANQYVANLDQGLVVPGIVDGIDELLDVHCLEGLKKRLVMDGIACQIGNRSLVAGLTHRSFLPGGLSSDFHTLNSA